MPRKSDFTLSHYCLSVFFQMISFLTFCCFLVTISMVICKIKKKLFFSSFALTHPSLLTIKLKIIGLLMTVNCYYLWKFQRVRKTWRFRLLLTLFIHSWWNCRVHCKNSYLLLNKFVKIFLLFSHIDLLILKNS